METDSGLVQKRMRFKKYPDWCGGGLMKVGVVTEFRSPMT